MTGWPLDAGRFQEAFSQFPGGACVATGLDGDGAPFGVLLGGVVPVAVDSARVVLALGDDAGAVERLVGLGQWCVLLLGQGQEELVRRFSAPGPDFAGLSWRPAPSGAPILDGVACWLDCQVTQVVRDGDLAVLVARVSEVGLAANVRPILSYQGGYGDFAPGLLSAVSTGGLDGARRVAELAEGPIEVLASELGVECGVVGYEDGHTVALAVANHSPAARRTRLGYRIPVVPPLGIQFVGSPGSGLTEESWLARLGEGAEGEADLVRWQLARVRERGWSLMLDGPLSTDQLDQLVSNYTDPAHTSEQEAALLEAVRVMAPYHEPEDIIDSEIYDVIALSVPVQAPTGETVVVLRMLELPPQASGSEVRSWLSLLQEAAQSVERRLTDDRLRPVLVNH
jgi:flavin reductase (DIM6/NTAB) family NADH-FMN oxidoreductase RutF